MSHVCPDCLLPLRVDTQGCDPARVNGVTVFTATNTQVTCFTPTCRREGITLEVKRWFALTNAEIESYHRGVRV